MDIEARKRGDIGDVQSYSEKGHLASTSSTDEAVAALLNVNERKVLRKIDRRVVPLMFACYCLQYLDKTLGKACIPADD